MKERREQILVYDTGGLCTLSSIRQKAEKRQSGKRSNKKSQLVSSISALRSLFFIEADYRTLERPGDRRKRYEAPRMSDAPHPEKG